MFLTCQRFYSGCTAYTKFALAIFVSFIAIDCAAQDVRINTQLADTLNFYKICTGNNYLRLVADIHNKKFNNSFDILHYCDKGIIIDLAHYQEEPEKWFGQIHKEISELLPELKFSDFHVAVALETDSSFLDEDEKKYNAVVSLQANGRVYKQKESIAKSVHPGTKRPGFFCPTDGGGFLRIFNKVLVDIQSPYRIQVIFGNETKGLGIIALTKEQDSILDKYNDIAPSDVEEYDYDYTLTSQKIEQAIVNYRKIGLFAHLTEQQIKNSIELVGEETIFNLNSILEKFPCVLEKFNLSLQWVTDSPYTELTKKLSLISHGVFIPVQFHENYTHPVNQKVTFGFSLNGKLYVTQLNYSESRDIDFDFLSFINNAIKENNIKGQFYVLDGLLDRLYIPVIFLTGTQSQDVKVNHLLVFSPAKN